MAHEAMDLPVLRRSTRVRRQPGRLVMNMDDGPRYDVSDEVLHYSSEAGEEEEQPVGPPLTQEDQDELYSCSVSDSDDDFSAGSDCDFQLLEELQDLLDSGCESGLTSDEEDTEVLGLYALQDDRIRMLEHLDAIAQDVQIYHRIE
jgi:hypothetical protein